MGGGDWSGHSGGQVVPRPDTPTVSKFLQPLSLWDQALLPPGQTFSLDLSGQVDTTSPGGSFASNIPLVSVVF